MSGEIAVPLLYFFGLSIVWLTVAMVIVRRFFDTSFVFLMFSAYTIIIPGLFYLFDLNDLPSSKLIESFSSPLLFQGLIAVVFIMGLMIGFVSFAKPSSVARFFPHVSSDQIRSVMFVGIFLLTIASGLFAAFALFLGGGLFEAVELVRYDKLYGDFNFLRQFVRIGTFLSIAYLLDSYLRKRAGENISRTTLRIATLFLCINFFAALITGGKTYLVYPLFTLVIGYTLYFSKSPLKTLIPAFLMLVIVVIGLQYARIVYVAENDFNIESQIITGGGMGYLDTNLIYLDLMADQIDLGEDFYNGAVGIIPRFLWPGKPETITAGGNFRRTVVPTSKAGWPVFGFNLWYSNFGWIGVFIGGVLSGFILKSLSFRYKDYRSNPYSLCFFCLFTIFLILPAGLSNLFFINYILNVLPIWIFLWLSSSKILPGTILLERQT
jgi:oligosaccharide repeat unit polymerase